MVFEQWVWAGINKQRRDLGLHTSLSPWPLTMFYLLRVLFPLVGPFFRYMACGGGGGGEARNLLALKLQQWSLRKSSSHAHNFSRKRGTSSHIDITCNKTSYPDVMITVATLFRDCRGSVFCESHSYILADERNWCVKAMAWAFLSWI